VRHLQHHDDTQPHELAVESQVDELLVLVAVADKERVRVLQIGERGNELGFAPDFKTIVKASPVGGNLLCHLLLLIHLDGKNPPIHAAILKIGDGLGETVVEFLDASLKDAGKSQEKRRPDPAGIELVEDLRDTHRVG